MTTEQAKLAEHPAPQPIPYPPGYPAGAYPPFFAYPHPQSDTESNGNPTPPPQYMMIAPPPPGMIYAIPGPPPHGQAFPMPPVHTSTTTAVASSPTRPKRKQVKMACTNCATACKRCDDGRPCERCIKYGIADSCIDGQRKERKKGVKRGPYKRKNKTNGGELAELPATTNEHTPPSSVQFPHEGYYPAAVYYPPPFLPVPDGHSPQDGSPTSTNGHPPIVPFYYPPYYPYGLVPQPLPGAQPQTDIATGGKTVCEVQTISTTTASDDNKKRLAKKTPQSKNDGDAADDSDSLTT